MHRALATTAANTTTARRGLGRAVVLSREWCVLVAVGLVAVSAMLGAALVAAGGAQAAKQVDSAFGTTSGTPALGATFQFPGFPTKPSVAVLQSTGQVYVADPSNRRIQRFNAAGEFERAWGWDVIQAGGSGDAGTGFEICTVAEDCQAGSSGGGAGQFTSQGGSLPGVQGVGIDQNTGHVYVTDMAARRIQKFDSDGNFILMWGKDVVSSGPGNTADASAEVCVPANTDVCKAGVNSVDALGGEFGTLVNGPAVDSEGNVYVTDISNGRVEKFDSNGVFIRAWGWDVVGANEQQRVTVNATGGSYTLTFNGETTAAINWNASPSTGAASVRSRLAALPSIGSIANLTVTGTNTGPKTITFPGALATTDVPELTANPAGLTGGAQTVTIETLKQGFGGPPDTGFEVCTVAAQCKRGITGDGLGQFTFSGDQGYLAVDSSDRVYVSSADGRIQRFGADGTSPESIGAAVLATAPGDPTGPLQIAIDTTDDHLYVVRPLLTESRILELNSEGDLVPDGTHAAGEGITSTLGLALNQGSGTLYVTSSQVKNWVLVLDDDGGVQPADTVVQPATDVTAHGAEFHAAINPNGFETTYRFEYSRDGVNWTPAGGFEPAGAGTDDVDVAVATDDLQANSLYRVRVVVRTLFAGEGTSPELTFATDTVAPEATTGAAQHVTSKSAQVRGRVNPNNLATSYQVEYGKTTAYGQKVPVPAGDVGSGGLEKLLVVQLEGLDSAKTYHYRFVATNAQGTTHGANRTFTTRAETSPDGTRTYEMVTPPDKSSRAGGSPSAQDSPLVGLPSRDGESLLFSLRFRVLTGDGGQSITHTFNPALFRRSPTGWNGDALNNVPTDQPSLAGLSNAAGLSSDLEVQAWQHDEWLFPSGSRYGTRVFGDDGGLNGSGWYDWLGTNPFIGPEARRDLALVTDDGSKMLRWGGDAVGYRGLLGAGAADPSNSQLAGEDGGDAVYLQDLPDGDRDLVNECTGTGSAATEIPMLDDNGTLTGGPQAAAFASSTTGSAQVTVDSMLSPDPFTAGQVLNEGFGGVALAFPSGTSITAVSGNTITMSAVATATVTNDFLVADPNPAAAADDAIAAQPCEEGTVTSLRGAASGGGVTFDGGVGPAASGPVRNAMSADGDRVFFTSPDPLATNVPSSCGPGVGAATDCTPQVFVRQYDSSGEPTVRWLSRSEVDGQEPGLFGSGAGFEGASRDGRVVYFRTNAPLTADDSNGTGSAPVTTGTASDDSWDLYRYELPADNDDDPDGGSLTRVSGGPSGAYDPGVLNVDGVAARAGTLRFLSDDGEKAYFVTRGAIGAPDDDWNAAPEGGVTAVDGPSAGGRNLYLYDATQDGDARWRFIARLPYTTSSSSPAACASHMAPSGLSQRAETDEERAPANCVHGVPTGDFIAFETTGQLTADDDDAASDIYAYDSELDQLSRVSAPTSDTDGFICANEGSRCNATFGRVDFVVRAEQVGLNGAQNQNVAMGGDGPSVFFQSRLPLVEEDQNGSLMDVYEWQAGELSLVSPASPGNAAWFSGNSFDGEDVFFSTAERIDPREIDEDFDIYDARVGGGIPLPADPEPGCDALGDGCQGGGGSGIDTSRESDRAGGGGNAPGGLRVELSVRRPAAKALRRAGRSGVLGVVVSTTGPGRVDVAARARLGGKVRRVAAAKRSFAKAGRATLRLKLSTRARERLRTGRRLRLSLAVRMADARGRSMTLAIPGGRR